MSNKVVVLTGGSSGMGAATVAQLLEAGHSVHNLDVQDQDSDAVFYRCDLSDRSSIDTTMASLPDRIDALVNVAGIADAEVKDKVIRVNFLGLRHLTEGLYGRINDHGSVTIVSSTAGLGWLQRSEVVNELLDTEDFDSGLAWARGNEGRWIKDPYTYSKQCALVYTYRLAGRGLDRRICANCLCPGAVKTPLTPEFRRLMGEDQEQWGVESIGRYAMPAEVAQAICFFAVGSNSWLNGVAVPLDGGFSAGGPGGWIDETQSPAAIRAREREAARRRGES